MTPASMPTASRRPRTLLAVLLIVVAAVASWWPRLGGPIDLRWDGGAYYILGTSLAEGHGYRMQSEPGSIESSLHPPLLPVVVAAHERVLGTSDPTVVGRALRVTMLLCAIACAIAAYALLAAFVPRRYAVAAVVIGLLQPQTAYFTDAFYAELPFGLFTVLFFVFHRRRERTTFFLLSGLCALLAYEARTAGIALLAAWVVDAALRKEIGRTTVALAASLAVVLAWAGWIKAVEASPEYRQPAYAYQTAPYLYFNVSYARNMLTLQDPSTPELGPLTARGLADRVRSNVQALPKSIGQAMSTWTAPDLLAYPLAGLVLVGVVLLARRRQFAMLVYVALSLAAMCSTPFQKQFVRYLLPLYPFFALALFLVPTALASRAGVAASPLRRRAIGVATWAVVGAVVAQEARELSVLYRERHEPVSYAARDGSEVRYRLFYYGPVGVAFDQALDWLRVEDPRGEGVVAATDPQWVHLRTGMKAVLPPFELDPAKAQQLVDTVPVRYLVVETAPDRLGLGAYHRFTSTLLRGNPDRWAVIWRSADDAIRIYRRTGSAAVR